MDVEIYREKVIEFVDSVIRPNLATWEESGSYPLELHALAAKENILSLGQNPDDEFHDDLACRKVLIEELSRSGSQAMVMALASHFVSLNAFKTTLPETYTRLCKQIFSGKKTLVLALTEPQAGSDLKSIQCEASLEAGGEYLLSGEKTFICNGNRADYMLTAARLDKKLTLFLVKADKNSITSTAIPCLGWQGLPIASIKFNRVKATRVGEPGQAGRLLQQILLQERLSLAVMANTSAMVTFEAALEYSKRRKVQGSPLFEQQIIRHRLADMHGKIELCRAYINQYIAAVTVSGPDAKAIAIAKNQAVEILEEVAAKSVQIHGASGCISGSQAERIYRDARLLGLGGGSTEVMNEMISRLL
ncbi:acyl-CoA dehydrogenase family protein [Shewanella woodyi]|uniref:acyl-CoA dehydrogenase family protein n=1 Tax=Shewanella woodyi TaxID=60961 RepID=UPI0007F87AA9|nr:acyl-CoA dehydrogenase family protein [Shewanella woodyi]